LNFNGKKYYFAGTSSGLFSTAKLNGDSTIWTKEGAGTIGNVIVDMISARETDGFIAVATHGNGVYSTFFNPAFGIDYRASQEPFRVKSVFPNPFTGPVTVELFNPESTDLEISLLNTNGQFRESLYKGKISRGDHKIQLTPGSVEPGIYYLVIRSGKEKEVRKLVSW
jgi:hypothetical protein